jgi:hypothetical protein
MDGILQDFSPERLAIANEENLASWLLVFGKLEGGHVDDINGIKRAINKVPLPLLNSVMDARLAPEQVQPTIDNVIGDAKARNVPVLWWIGPSTRPENLARHLLKNGFTVDEDGPGMAADLENLNEGLLMPDGLSIQPALDDESWWAWSRTMAQGFEVPPTRIEFAVNTWHDLLSQLNPKTTLGYTARLNGNPVATSLLQLGGGVAGIYGVATIPEACHKGIGAQVTLYPILQARAWGYKIGILQASEMGLPVYRALGFKEYCRITSYLWSPN